LLARRGTPYLSPYLSKSLREGYIDVTNRGAMAY
jgi:hypothetical protein